jgi:sporulation protein YlmC with PRC-barrel domain
MSERVVHVEQLLGRRVRDASGRVVGRIEEIRARRVGREVVVQEYLLGPQGLFARLAISGWRAPRRRNARHRSRIPWDQMDLVDPRHPRLRSSASISPRRPDAKRPAG